MEIMTTWNTDFEFDLQRFAGEVDLTADTVIGDADSTVKDFYISATGSISKNHVSTDLAKLTFGTAPAAGDKLSDDIANLTGLVLYDAATVVTMSNTPTVTVTGADYATKYVLGTAEYTVAKSTTAGDGAFTSTTGTVSAVTGVFTITSGTVSVGATAPVTLSTGTHASYSVVANGAITLPGTLGTLTPAITTGGGAAQAVIVDADGTVNHGTGIAKFTTGGTFSAVLDTANSLGITAVDTNAEVTGGAVTVASTIDLTGDRYVKLKDLKITAVGTADATLTYTTGAVTGATSVVTATGTGNVLGVEFTNATGEVTGTSENVNNLAAGSTITGAAGTVTTLPLTSEQSVNVNNVLYVSGSTASGGTAINISNTGAVTNGSVILVGGTKGMVDSTVKLVATDTVSYSGGSDGVVIGVTTAINTCTFTDLDNGEQVIMNGVTYKATGAKTVAVTKGGTTKWYSISNGSEKAIFTTDNNVSAPSTAAGGTVTELKAGNIVLADHASTSKIYFNSVGVATEEKADDSVVEVSNSTSNGVTTSTVTVTGALSTTPSVTQINTQGVVAKVTDKSGAANQYVLDSAGAIVTLGTAGGSFSTTTAGVISALSGTVTALVDSVNYTTTVSDGKFDMSQVLNGAGTGSLTFSAGTSINGASITTVDVAGTGTNTITLTESGNNGSSAVDTVISETTPAASGAVAITGVDGDFTVTKALAGTTVKTTGNGTATINGRTYTVAGDDDGVEFTVANDASNNPHVNAIAGLAAEATVTTAKLTSVALTVGATAFTDLTAKSGAVFTSVSNGGNATVTLNAGDTVTIGNNVYMVKKSSDGVIIGDTDGALTAGNGTLGGLTEGDQVVVSNAGGTNKITYTVSNGVLEVETSAGYTELWTVDDSSEPFSVSAINADALPTAVAKSTVANGTSGTNLAGALSVNTTGITTASTAINASSSTLYITKENKVVLTQDKAVAKVTTSDDGLVTYDTLADKSQYVNVTGDTANRDNWVVNTLGGKDTVNYAAPTADATISTGAGNDTITASGAGDKVITMGDGKDELTLTGNGAATVNAGAGNDTIRATVGTGDIIINAESGNNDIAVTGTGTGSVTIAGGSGNDTIKARSTDDVVSGGDGKDVFDITGSSVKINDYSFGDDVIVTAVAPTVTMLSDEGKIVTTAGTADISANAGDFYAADIKSSVAGAKATHFAWAKDGGSNIDVSTYDKDAVLKGDADGVNTLYTGAGDDYIYSYAENDSVYGGAGKDSIDLSTAVGVAGRVVGVATTSSKDTVDGFKASFEEGDSIFMVDGAASDVKASFANNTVTFKDGEGSLQLNNVTTSSTGAVELNVSGAKVALAAASVGGAIAADSTSYANFYMGNNAAVSFAAAEGEVNVDLRNGLDSGAEGAKFSGITAVAGGAGQNTLIGGTAGETLTAGTGTSSLWGGAGKDTLVGNGASDAFFIGAGDGSDVVLNFSAAGNENADTVYALNDITGAKLTSNGVEISVGDTDKLTLRNVTADTAIKFNSNGNAGVAKVGSATTANNFSYDSTVTYYGGGNKSDKIAFSSGYTENAQIWLDGSQGKAYASIDVVDGTNTSGNLIVAGDSSSQSIIGGKGDTSLWGGAGSVSDTLRSSSNSKTMFWWGAGEGNDVVVSASADDSVNLYNLKLSDVDVANSSITNSGVVLALNDGSKLTVQTTRDMTFSIDGQSWTAQHSSKEWKQNS